MKYRDQNTGKNLSFHDRRIALAYIVGDIEEISSLVRFNVVVTLTCAIILGVVGNIYSFDVSELSTIGWLGLGLTLLALADAFRQSSTHSKTQAKKIDELKLTLSSPYFIDAFYRLKDSEDRPDQELVEKICHFTDCADG